MLEKLHLDNTKRISPGFWGAIAGGAAAGATVFSNNRIFGALVLGGGMFLVALQLTPCCDGCAAGKGCGDSASTQNAGASAPASTPTPAPASQVTARALMAAAGDGNPIVRGLFRDQQASRIALSPAARTRGCS